MVLKHRYEIRYLLLIKFLLAKKGWEGISKFFIKLNILNFKDVLNSEIVLPILFVVLYTCVYVLCI